jgi:hypothetical protein
MQPVRASVHGGTQAHGQPTGVRPHALWVAEAFSCPWVRLMEVALGNGRRSFLGVLSRRHWKRKANCRHGLVQLADGLG